MSSRCGASEAPRPTWSEEAAAWAGVAMARPASSDAAAARMPRPFIERLGIASQPGPAHADAELATVDRRRFAATVVVIGDGGREHLAGNVGPVLASGLEQVGVACEREGDAVGDLEAGGFARVLDGVDDLTSEPLAAQLVVELELEGHGVAGLGLDLVALERLQCQRQVLGRERVLVAVDVDAHLAPLADDA